LTLINEKKILPKIDINTNFFLLQILASILNHDNIFYQTTSDIIDF